MSSEAAPQVPVPKGRINAAFKQLRLMHWVMAACYVVVFIVGVLMAHAPIDPVRANFYTFHRSMGALTIALLTARIFFLQQVWWRKFIRQRPKMTGAWLRGVLLHTALYVFMIIVPLSGFFLSNSFRSGVVSFFWLVTLPDLFPQNAEVVGLARSLHFWLVYTFFAFVLVHLLEQRKFVQSQWRRFTKASRKAV
ncbi:MULTISPECIES: cytochrome b/b6 domain-containing protein [unclassified Leptolyngbya]|uniref:cytochrome b n=1 Tax=unclassified Leptolyngbya TaxID=2650499 RepID=UPI0016896A4F|nr:MULTISPECIES: cytochrome b/b6 domain-containing protein [unclassified Leptolyngbya]MBD1913800.1 cytochrome b [Leptolyngbya sp. FACHB-8]MBD2153616.1 cytochrome b [Leptolyngbya sp. FACHB-16]